MSDIDTSQKNPYTPEELENICNMAWNASQIEADTSWHNEYINGWTSYTIEVGASEWQNIFDGTAKKVPYIQTNWEFNGGVDCHFFTEDCIDGLSPEELREDIRDDYEEYMLTVQSVIDIDAAIAVTLEEWPPFDE